MIKIHFRFMVVFFSIFIQYTYKVSVSHGICTFRFKLPLMLQKRNFFISRQLHSSLSLHSFHLLLPYDIAQTRSEIFIYFLMIPYTILKKQNASLHSYFCACTGYVIRSLDPILDIQSIFLKKKNELNTLFFTSFLLKKMQLVLFASFFFCIFFCSHLFCLFSSVLTL